MALKSAYALKKEIKALKEERDALQTNVVLLRSEIMERSTEFMAQLDTMEKLVDYIFDNDEVRTLKEAQKKWRKFVDTIHNTDSIKAAIDELGVEVVVSYEECEKTLVNWWEADRAKHREKMSKQATA